MVDCYKRFNLKCSPFIYVLQSITHCWYSQYEVLYASDEQYFWSYGTLQSFLTQHIEGGFVQS